MQKVVLGAADGIFERIVRLYEVTKPTFVASLQIIRVIALGEVAEDPFYRFRRCLRADFQQLVVVNEHCRGASPSHHPQGSESRKLTPQASWRAVHSTEGLTDARHSFDPAAR